MGVKQEPTSDLQGLTLHVNATHGVGLALGCKDCSDWVESWRQGKVDLVDVIEVAREHKRLDLARKWSHG